MNKISDDDGIFVVLIERGKRRLERALRIKRRVDAGGLLTDTDIDFLEEVMSTSQKNAGLIERNPEWHEIYAKSVRVYGSIKRSRIKRWRTKKHKNVRGMRPFHAADR
jgi:hypothetical protein